MHLTSSAFRDGETIPRRYTCDGDNISPPFSWTAAPKGTRSFALICDDPDAPRGTWHHWAIFDIPADRSELAEHISRADRAGGMHQAQNDFRRTGYDGPCPPHGHGPHRYHFRLIALSVDVLRVDSHSSCVEVAAAAERHALAEAELTGLYAR